MIEIKVVSGRKRRFLLRFLARVCSLTGKNYFQKPYQKPKKLPETYFNNILFLVPRGKKFLDWEGLKGRGLTGDLEDKN